MNIKNSMRQLGGLSACGIATTLLGASLAIAKGYDIAIDTAELQAEPVARSMPAFPDDKSVKKGQEGWVQVTFAVDKDGRAVDAVVTRSAGGDAFEQSALAAIAEWRFTPEDIESGRNVIEMRFEHSNDSGKASRGFVQYYRMIQSHLAGEKMDKARAALERARKKGGWNLYETTILDVVEAKIAESEGDVTGQMAALRRALEIGNEFALTPKTKREILRDLIELEVATNRLALAQLSVEKLRDVKGSKSVIAELDETISMIGASLQEPLVIEGVIVNSELPWVHRAHHPVVSVTSVDGEIDRLETRCDHGRETSTAEQGMTVTLLPAWGDCDVLVFGQAGAAFRVEESLITESIALNQSR